MAISLQHILTFCMLTLLTCSQGAKVLIYPIDCGFNSRLMNLVKIADILNANGHNATVLVNTKVAKMLEPEQTTLLEYYVPNVENLPLVTDPEVLEMFKNFNMWDLPTFVQRWVDLMVPFCESVLGTKVIHDLKAEGYDLIITDNMWDCGRIVIDYLDIPALTYSNFGFTEDPYTFYPTLPSFMCPPGSTACLSDKMNFQERLGNFLSVTLIHYFMIPKVAVIYDKLKMKHDLNVSRSILDSNAFRSPVIVNGDFVLGYPRPVMPHVLMIPGLYHKLPKPLPEDLSIFIEESAPHGIVVVSFGSMVSTFDGEKAEIIAKVLGELPQRVLWRFTGEKPASLKDNTKLVSWFPQADVLRHPLVKMFITHCGISGTYEAAMNGLPVVAIPLFGDQMHNCRKLTERGGMGMELKLDTMTETGLRETVKEVMHNPKFLKNAKHVSALLQDTEISPKQKLLYWVDYVIRHNGARHLISVTALGMSNFVFYSVDVIMSLIVIIIILVVFLVAFAICLIKFILRCSKSNQKHKRL